LALSLSALLPEVFGGGVEWSDGSRQEGTLSTGANGTVRFHDGTRVREWPLTQVARITFHAEKVRQERAWRFVEAGQTRKEEWGDPFYVADLDADVWLHDGGRVKGHLLTTVLYLESGDTVEKVVLKRKLRGEPGAPFDAIRYPWELLFEDTPVAAPASALVTIDHKTAFSLAVVARSTMNSAAITPTSPANAWRITLQGDDLVVALRHGTTMRVGWHGTVDEATQARIAQGLVDLRDFFDGRQLLGVARDPADETVCTTLLLLYRRGATTLPATASQPWRLEVWRWHLGDGADLSATRRLVLFRGIKAATAPLPQVILDAQLARATTLAATLPLTIDAAAGTDHLVESTNPQEVP